jgi:NTP pyrophosphatase (non-canonical NTP hydrolase)
MNLDEYVKDFEGQKDDYFWENSKELAEKNLIVVLINNGAGLANICGKCEAEDDLGDIGLNRSVYGNWLSNFDRKYVKDEIEVGIDFDSDNRPIGNEEIWRPFTWFDDSGEASKGFVFDVSQIENDVQFKISYSEIKALESVLKKCYGQSKHMGWHDKPREEGTMLMLMVSEISEALEVVRKDKDDDHLPAYKSVTVELADCIIRILDYCGKYNLPVADALADKLEYNRNREDHKKENREKEGGKKF